MSALDHLAPLDLARKLTGDRKTVAHLAEALAEHLRPPTLYTCQTLAVELGCSPEAVGRAIRDGELPATRRAGRYVILAADVETWAQTGTRPVIRARRDRPGGRQQARDTPGAIAILGDAPRAA